MYFRRRGTRIPALHFWRRKLIRETEAALLAGLRHPEKHPRIPTVMVGVGEFDPIWAQRWWSAVLELDPLDRP